MKPWEIIKQLESTNSRLDKERILQGVLLRQPEDKEFWDGVRMALDALTTFGVKQVPIKEDVDGPGLDYDSFSLATTGLVSRSVTGNVARDMIARMAQSATRDQWNNWYRRILIKDLRCGVTETTINKVRPNTVQVFSCQLAKDAADNEKKLTGVKQLDFKLDGVRVLAVIEVMNLSAKTVPTHKVTLYSRNGKVFENFTHIENQLLSGAQHLTTGWVLDGEVTSTTFQALMTQARRKKDADASDAVFNLFDAIPLSDFLKGKHTTSQHHRSLALRALMNHFEDCESIRMLDFKTVDLDTSEGQETLENMRDEAAKLGLEGVMVKDAHAPYECKRTDAWLKIKPNITVDLTVTALEEGTGRNEGRLGAMVCEGVDQGRQIKVNVGSGFSDTQRTQFWNQLNRKDVVGQIVEVRADAVTQNQDGSYSLRFPRFIRFRGFEAGEKM